MALVSLAFCLVASHCTTGRRNARNVKYNSDELRPLPITYAIVTSGDAHNSTCPLDVDNIVAGAAMITAAAGIPFEMVAAGGPGVLLVGTGSDCGCNIDHRGAAATTINIGGCNEPGNAAHEFLHALGLAHEQKHSDRAAFIDVDISKVDEGWKHQWAEAGSRTSVTPFDFCSIMMYPLENDDWRGAVTVTEAGWDAIHTCIADNPTLYDETTGSMSRAQRKNAGTGATPGFQRSGLSVSDVAAITALYTTTPAPFPAPPAASSAAAVPYVPIAAAAGVVVVGMAICTCRRRVPVATDSVGRF